MAQLYPGAWRIWRTRAVSVIAQEKVCAACYRHAYSFLGACLGRQDILVDE